MVKNIIHVKILCINCVKTLCKICEQFCGLVQSVVKNCEQPAFLTDFFQFFHSIIHNYVTSFINYVLHIFTTPTTTTTKNN